MIPLAHSVCIRAHALLSLVPQLCVISPCVLLQSCTRAIHLSHVTCPCVAPISYAVQFISVPREMGSFTPAAIMAGIVKGVLDAAGFPARVTAHSGERAEGTCPWREAGVHVTMRDAVGDRVRNTLGVRGR